MRAVSRRDNGLCIGLVREVEGHERFKGFIRWHVSADSLSVGERVGHRGHRWGEVRHDNSPSCPLRNVRYGGRKRRMVPQVDVPVVG
jgi:hypothetical protein